MMFIVPHKHILLVSYPVDVSLDDVSIHLHADHNSQDRNYMCIIALYHFVSTFVGVIVL